MPTITISLLETMKQFIESQLQKEGFSTVSEYVRALVRDEQKRNAQARVESLLLQGLQSESAPFTAQDWRDIRSEVRQRARKGDKRGR